MNTSQIKFSRHVLEALVLAAVLLAGCLTKESDQSNRGSEVENEVRVGQIFLADGSPAIDAEVKVFSVDHIPGGSVIRKLPAKTSGAMALVFVTHTDGKGFYTLDSLERGEYNILSALNGQVAYRDSIFFTPMLRLPKDTLRNPGSLAGVVELQPDRDTRSVTVQVLGTDVFVNVDSLGQFRLSGLAEGQYLGRAITTFPEYAPLAFPIRIHRGKTDTLKDTLRLPFTGIPVVRGLKANYDTTQGLALLSWSPIGYKNLKGYLIMRTQSNAIFPTYAYVGRTTDTTFIDSVYFNADRGGILTNSLDGSSFSYVVRALNKSDIEGNYFESADVHVASPEWVASTLDLTCLNSSDNIMQIGDSVKLVLNFRNPTRRVKTLTWYQSGVPMPIRTTRVSALQGFDTLTRVWNDGATNPQIRVTVQDEGAGSADAQILLHILKDVPQVDAGSDTTITTNTPFFLHGKSSSRFGTLVEKREWNIGPGGKFVQVGAMDTTLVTSSVVDSSGVRYIYRVTLANGEIGMDTMLVYILRDIPMVDAGLDTSVAIGDPFVLHGKSISPYGTAIKTREWNIGVGGAFVPITAQDKTITASTVPDLTGTPYIYRVTLVNGEVGLDTLIVRFVHFRKLPTRTRHYPGLPTLTALGNGIYSIEKGAFYFNGGYRVDLLEYRPLDGKWYSRAGSLDAVGQIPILPVDGKLTAVGNMGGGALGVAVYDPNLDNWTNTIRNLGLNLQAYNAYSTNGKLYIYGGKQTTGSNVVDNYRLNEYDLISHTWIEKSFFPFDLGYTYRGALVNATVGDKLIYVLPSPDTWDFTHYLFEYTFSTDTWTAKKSIPLISNAIFASPSSTVAGNTVYLIGENGTMVAYDPASGSWIVKPKMPDAPSTAGFESVVVNDEVLFFANAGGVENAIKVWSYNFKTSTWLIKPQMDLGSLNKLGAFRVETWEGRVFILSEEYFFEYLP